MTREEAIVYGNDYYADLISACCKIDEKHKEFVRMSLEALEQEPCEDCISRQGAIDALGYNISITSDEGLDEYRTVLKEMLGKIYDTQKAQIEALPSIQPTTKENLVVGDCISRADAIANIRILYPDMPVVDIMGARHKWSEKYQQYRDCEKILADLPRIQPKPKTGHWISDKNGQYCDKCGNGIKTPYNFCPFCGADMRESEDKE